MCDNCVSGCGSSCSNNCGKVCIANAGAGNSCSTCDGVCLTNCALYSDGVCSNCSDACNRGCATGCSGECGGCGGSSCSGQCKGLCYGCEGSCGSACSGECFGGCNTSCNDTCDNACKTDSAPETISNLGINIEQGKIIKSEDFKELKTAVENELKRRNKSNSIHTSSKSTNVGNIVYKEHIQNIFSDIKSIDSSKTQSIDSTNIVYVKDLKEATKSIQLFMNENLK